MMKQNFGVNKLRVASPCSVVWETMSGDERVRHCHSCQLNIYNISEMSKNEVENLIANHEGRLCIRLYKRADGTVLTKDCPVGFRAYQKRISRFAGATLATILGLFSISFGQKQDEKSVDASEVTIVRTENQNQESILYGIIADPNGTIISGAQIKLLKKGQKKARKAKSDSDGKYKIGSLSEGIYGIEIKYTGFQTLKIRNLEIKKNEKNQLNIVFQLTAESVTVGIYAEEPLIDVNSSSVTTTITRKMIDKLPH